MLDPSLYTGRVTWTSQLKYLKNAHYFSASVTYNPDADQRTDKRQKKRRTSQQQANATPRNIINGKYYDQPNQVPKGPPNTNIEDPTKAKQRASYNFRSDNESKKAQQLQNTLDPKRISIHGQTYQKANDQDPERGSLVKTYQPQNDVTLIRTSQHSKNRSDPNARNTTDEFVSKAMGGVSSEMVAVCAHSTCAADRCTFDPEKVLRHPSSVDQSTQVMTNII